MIARILHVSRKGIDELQANIRRILRNAGALISRGWHRADWAIVVFICFMPGICLAATGVTVLSFRMSASLVTMALMSCNPLAVFSQSSRPCAMA